MNPVNELLCAEIRNEMLAEELGCVYERYEAVINAAGAAGLTEEKSYLEQSATVALHDAAAQHIQSLTKGLMTDIETAYDMACMQNAYYDVLCVAKANNLPDVEEFVNSQINEKLASMTTAYQAQLSDELGIGERIKKSQLRRNAIQITSREMLEQDLGPNDVIIDKKSYIEPYDSPSDGSLREFRGSRQSRSGTWTRLMKQEGFPMQAYVESDIEQQYLVGDLEVALAWTIKNMPRYSRAAEYFINYCAQLGVSLKAEPEA